MTVRSTINVLFPKAETKLSSLHTTQILTVAYKANRPNLGEGADSVTSTGDCATILGAIHRSPRRMVSACCVTDALINFFQKLAAQLSRGFPRSNRPSKFCSQLETIRTAAKHADTMRRIQVRNGERVKRPTSRHEIFSRGALVRLLTRFCITAVILKLLYTQVQHCEGNFVNSQL